VLSLAGVAYAAGVRVNLSRSIPQGFYRRIDAPIVRGSLVLACLPQRIAALAREREYVHQGSCGDGNAPVGKTVVAVANDIVDVTERGVFVDGRLVANSAPLGRDSRGRVLPTLRLRRHVVPPGEIWLVSSYSDRSFDSRYFGGIAATGVLSVVRPILLVKEGMVKRSPGTVPRPLRRDPTSRSDTMVDDRARAYQRVSCFSTKDSASAFRASCPH
jgi:conjugative transfer signal peptidase TraF